MSGFRGMFIFLLAAAAVAVGAPAVSASPVTSPMTCTGGPGGGLTYRYGVTGTATMPDVPSGITVTRYSSLGSSVVLTTDTPVLDNTYGGGYWLRTYGLNAWNLGSVSGTTYWLLLPGTTFGVIVTGQLHTVYAAGGYLASGLNCTVPGATGNVGPFTGKGGSRYTAVQVTGVIAAPAAPAGVTVVKTYTGITVISGASPVLDNTYGGGYWKRTYHWNAWNLGPDQAGNAYWLLLPDTPLSASFSGQLQIVYAAGGNNQIPLAYTISA